MLPVYTFPPALAGSVILALAIVTLTYGRRDRLSVSFALFCGSWAVVAALTRISIRTEDAGPEVRVVVEDDGPGISEQDLPRIFEPGFTTRGVGVGTGMGLALAYRVVEDHGGEVDVRSEVGRGTRVQVSLPREPPGASA